MAGLHEASWVTTVPGTAAADAFNVRDYRAILSLAEGKNHIGVDTWTGDDDELRNFLLAVTEVVESKVGPCVRRTVTQRVADTQRQDHRPEPAPRHLRHLGHVRVDRRAVLDHRAARRRRRRGHRHRPVRRHAVLVGTLGRRLRRRPGRRTGAAHPRRQGTAPPPVGNPARPAPGTRTRRRRQFTTSAGWAFTVPNKVLELLSDDMTPAI